MADKYLTKQKTAARYGVTPRTVDRWEREYTIGFPAAIVINNRRLYAEEQLVAWERARAAANTQAAAA